jgi:hypothetical protein
MNYSKYVNQRKQNELNKIKVILQRAKKDSLFITESSDLRKIKKKILPKVNQSIKRYYALSLMEREFKTLRSLKEGLNYLGDEEKKALTIVDALEKLQKVTKGTEIGNFIKNYFADLISSFDKLRNVEDFSAKPVDSKFARNRGGTAGYGGGMSLGTAGIMREVFGSPPPPSASRRTARLPIPQGGTNRGVGPTPAPAQNKPMFKATPEDLEYERQQNISQDLDRAMQTFEKKLPIAEKFISKIYELFTDEAKVKTLSAKAGFFKSLVQNKKSILTNTFGEFAKLDPENLNLGILVNEFEENPNLALNIRRTVSSMEQLIGDIQSIKNITTQKIVPGIRDYIKNLWSAPTTQDVNLSGGGMMTRPANR